MNETTTTATLVHLDPGTLTWPRTCAATPRSTPPSCTPCASTACCPPWSPCATATGGCTCGWASGAPWAPCRPGCPRIPVYVVEGDLDGDVERILEQVAENDARTALGVSDRARAWQQLAAFGLSPTQIAKRSGRKRAEVQAGLAVADSQVASSAAAAHDLTLGQAAVLAEFDDDADAVQALTDTAHADPARFAHLAQRLRDARAEARAVAAMVDDLTGQGIAVQAERPAYDDATALPLHRLTRDGQDGEVAVADVRDLPGLFAHVAATWRGVEAVYYLRGWAEHGFTDRYATTSGQVVGGPLSEEDKEQRRTVVANNKAWRSAETVRREWLATLGGRASAPKDAARVLAHLSATRYDALAKAGGRGHQLARRLLGLPQTTGYGDATLTEAIAAASPARAQVIALVLALAAVEETTATHTWRSTGEADYFSALARWGYPLSDVEALTPPGAGTPAED
jgi:ParB family chromosome partitioning protein